MSGGLIFKGKFQRKRSLRISVGIKYSIGDVICYVISSCVWSCDVGENWCKW